MSCLQALRCFGLFVLILSKSGESGLPQRGPGLHLHGDACQPEDALWSSFSVNLPRVPCPLLPSFPASELLSFVLSSPLAISYLSSATQDIKSWR